MLESFQNMFDIHFLLIFNKIRIPETPQSKHILYIYFPQLHLKTIFRITNLHVRNSPLHHGEIIIMGIKLRSFMNTIFQLLFSDIFHCVSIDPFFSHVQSQHSVINTARIRCQRHLNYILIIFLSNTALVNLTSLLNSTKFSVAIPVNFGVHNFQTIVCRAALQF